MERPTLEQLVSLIRQHLRIPHSTRIAAETLIEADLGCSGDDADELLETVADQFNISLFDSETQYRQLFGLAPNEELFHSEGELCNWPFLRLARFFGNPRTHAVVDLTVGQLHEAILRAPGKDPT